MVFHVQYTPFHCVWFDFWSGVGDVTLKCMGTIDLEQTHTKHNRSRTICTFLECVVHDVMIIQTISAFCKHDSWKTYLSSFLSTVNKLSKYLNNQFMEKRKPCRWSWTTLSITPVTLTFQIFINSVSIIYWKITSWPVLSFIFSLSYLVLFISFK